MESSTPKKTAVPNERILSPVTILLTRISIAALITRLNSPRVMKLTGRKSRLTTGFIKKFTNAKTMAAKMA